MEIDRRKLTLLREQRGLHLAALAREAGLSRSFMTQVANGEREPSPITVKAIAQALGVTVEELKPIEGACPHCGRSPLKRKER